MRVELKLVMDGKYDNYHTNSRTIDLTDTQTVNLLLHLLKEIDWFMMVENNIEEEKGK